MGPGRRGPVVAQSMSVRRAAATRRGSSTTSGRFIVRFRGAFVALLLIAAPAFAQYDDPPTIGGVVAKAMGEIGSGVVEFQQAKGEFSRQIKEARANYWASYNGPGFDAAAAKFREALLAKDLIHLSIYLVEGRPTPYGR